MTQRIMTDNQKLYEVDTIALETGFSAISGGLAKIDIN